MPHKLNVLKPGIAATALLLTSSAIAAAAGTFDWTRVYIGGLAGASFSDSTADVHYGDEIYPSANGAGWTNGYFVGDVYQDIEDSFVDLSPGNDSALLDVGPLLPWTTSASESQTDWIGVAVLGAQWMTEGGVVYGAELRGAFGGLGTSHSEAWNSPGTVTGASATCDIEFLCSLNGDIPNFGFVPLANWSPDPGNLSILGVANAGQDVTIDGTYGQVNTFNFGVDYGPVFSPVAKLGLAAERYMLFVMAGPSWASVKATTSASVSEAGTVTTDAPNLNGDLTTSGTASYAWSGEKKSNRLGYTAGAGVEYAATDNIILRFEGAVTDLGSISVTGVEAGSDAASYTVKQDLMSYAVSTGVLIGF